MLYCQFFLTVLLVALSSSQAPYNVKRVDNPSFVEEYQCVGDNAPENTIYTWQRQGWPTLPEGVQAERDRLHFLKSTSDLNGQYICTARNQNGINSASLYRFVEKSEDTFLQWILDMAHPQLVYVTPVDSPTKEETYLCVAEADPEHTKYSWQRQDGNLPEDVKAAKNQLHFLKSSSDLNGLYICIAENKFGKAMGSLFRYKIKETIFHNEL